MRLAKVLFCAILAFIFVFSSLVYADVPDSISYQGKLTTPVGLLIDGNYAMTFKIYDVAVGGVALWTEAHPAVTVDKGVFSVMLGSITSLPATVFDGSVRYLGVQVGGDPEMTPRKEIVSVAYAYRAGTAGADNDWIFPTDAGGTNPRPYLYTYGAWGIARYGNVLYGNADSTHVNLGVASTTGTNGQNYKYCTVGGGVANTASGDRATVGGGWSNTANGGRATVGGGYSNTASGNYATVGGGFDNTASGVSATVGGGFYNTASFDYATVGGGATNTASEGGATVGGGGGNTASGEYSTIPGGYSDTLTGFGYYSMIFGAGVYVNTGYRVVFFDGSYSGRLGINRDDRDGGISYPIHVGTGTGNGNGAYLTNGGVWTNGSSRNFKENFQTLNSQELLKKISNLPVEAWSFKNSEERHIGPVAEDFIQAFDVGTVKEDGNRDNQYLSAEDIAGVALAGVKEMIKENQELKQVIEELRHRIMELEKTR